MRRFMPFRAARLGNHVHSLGFAVLAGMFLAGRMVGPIQALRAGAERIGGGDLSQQIRIKTRDELEALADQFNVMAGRLKDPMPDWSRRSKSARS